MKERRKFKRFPVNLKLKYKLILDDMSGKVKNISKNGILFNVTEEIEPDSYLFIEFTTPQKKRLKSYIKIVRSNKIEDNNYEIGAKFLSIESEIFNNELNLFLQGLEVE